MDVTKAELCYVQLFYKDSTIFLTGATEFVGKLLLEKILRSLPVKKVFVLIEKNGEYTPEVKLQKLFEATAFDPIRRIDQNFQDKVKCLSGDCSLPNLGLSENDINLIINEVDCIFHCADTAVRFDEKLSLATFINVRATRDLINIARRIKQLKTFVHMSSAFSNITNIEIHERIYEPAIAYDKLLNLCETVNENLLEKIAPNIIGKYPNTYLFTKQVAEDAVKDQARNLPSCIVRPSLVISASEEPLAGYVDEANTLAEVILMQVLGIERIAYRHKENNLDLVPVDYVVNHALAAGWFVGEAFKKNKNKDTDVEVFNMVSSQDSPLKVGEMENIVLTDSEELPSKKMVWYPNVCVTTCYYNFVLWKYLLHILPAYFLDYVLNFFGKQPIYTEMYNKLHKLSEALDVYRLRELYFSNDNTKRILKRMTFKDRELFNFDAETLNWLTYFPQYLKGLRVYVLKDPMGTIKEAKKRKERLKVCYISTIITVIAIVYVISKFVLFRLVPRIISI